MVLLHHLAQYVPYGKLGATFWWLQPFELIGGQGVAIFFVLSGFLLAGPFWDALDRQQPMPDLRVFFLRRFARIAPGFWLALTVTFLTAWLLFGAPLNNGYILRYLAGMTFLAELHWFTLFPVELNGPLWSIGFEVSAYAIMPLCFLLLFGMARTHKNRFALRAAWIGVMLGILGLHVAYVTYWGRGGALDISAIRSTPFWLIYLGEYWFPEYNPFGFFVTFAFGVLASGLLRLLPRQSHWSFDVIFVMSLAAAARMLWTSRQDGFDPIFNLPYGMFPQIPLLIGITLAVGPRTIMVARSLEPASVRYFAKISFGVYLWHVLCLNVIGLIFFPTFKIVGEKSDDVYVLLSGFGIAIFASICIAAASWRFLERPAVNWARRQEVKFSVHSRSSGGVHRPGIAGRSDS
jgi:hypothetical protein